MRYLLLLLPMLALASDDDRGGGDATATSSSTSGADAAASVVTGDVDASTVISGGRAYALSGGDMDINQCIATHSVLFGMWQGTHLNAICVADVLDANGKHKEAAEMRCSVKRFRKVYGTEYECVRDTQFIPLPPPPAPVMKEGKGGYDLEEYREEHEQVDDNIEKRLDRIEAGNRAAARKSQERRDYAQQTLERLENDPEE